MVSDLLGVLRQKLRNPHFEAKGTANVHGKDNWLDNDDIRPLKLADRTWNVWTYLTFWFSATSTVSTWYAASSAQALGLSMWESVLCAFGGQCLIAFVIVFNGRSGAVYHIGYPILNRAAFGVFGAWWPTFNRAVMAIVWNGVNAVQGGECIYVMFHTLSPHVANFKNVMGEGSALNSGGMLGLGIFWILTCCFLIIPVPKMKGLVYAKLIVFIISAIAMCAWTLTMAGGIGPVARQPGTIKGTERTWLLVRFVLLGAANCATFASNAADFQRYARKPNDVILGNLLGFPISNLIVAIIAGNDIAALFPKYISIRTGFFICAVLSIAIQPWYLLKSASIFISFLASYQIFLSAITGVLLCHYFIIARGFLKIPDLYTSDKKAAYYYTGGWNWRAYAAFMVYWGVCWKWPVEVQYKLGEWMEVKDYVREEERADGEGSRWGSMVSGEEGQTRTGVLESGEKGDFQVEKGTAVGYRGPETRIAER
ncbi:hypothetical protein DID88_006050 [Monilinia fructigena]|uniref:Uracil permease n=1 Tax=Monilinia fructigena TaxID=38457 RepID=A0A395IDT2_9HELO|nr:hypothetical protein DID88_006050 [Monilinia fructigena]